jgi:excinuclease ABC subunit C
MPNLLEDIKKIPLREDRPLPLPESAGIYLFLKKDAPIYVGKAINLKRRVSSYFDLKLDPKTSRMIKEAEKFSFIQVESELSALLLEAKLIHRYLPKYNIVAKDDKHPLYIRITKEKYPRVITARKIAQKEPNLAFYGPFPSSKNVYSVLRMIRRIFPYSDHTLGKRGCIYSHIGLCNPCPNEIEHSTKYTVQSELKSKYLKNIKTIKSILDGNIGKVKKNLEKEMDKFSKQQKYEEAGKARDQIKKLEYITQPQLPSEFYIQNPNLYEDARRKELGDLQKILDKQGLFIGKIKRIECFDVAHLAGSNPTASMVTFINGEPEKSYYRHFKIRQTRSPDDYASLREVIKRRIKYLDADAWGKPDLIVVDGGKGQVSVFIRELKGLSIPIIGIAKRFETLVIPKVKGKLINLKEYKMPKGPALNLIQRIRNEAHRFAQKYHHQLISKSLIMLI